MVKTLYTVIYYILSPLMCVRWFFKSLKPPKYREPFHQRFGFVDYHNNVDIWFHAVSMGESSGAISIINKLLADNSNLNIVVTTTTPTGAKLVLKALGEKITHYYSPCDLPGSINRFVKRVSPKLVVIMETELWPNWIEHLYKNDIPLILANARLSESSAKKYETFATTSKNLFSKIGKILAVNSADAKRFSRIGAHKDSIAVTGNIKFDASFPEKSEQEFFPYWKQQFIWIAASTHQGENSQILNAHQQLLESIPDAKLIIVPRHPERFQVVEDLIEKESFVLAKRSEPATWCDSSQVLLGDSMGELLLAYQKADVAFIAGSLADVGGHNAIEAAYYSKPILTGPIYHNFQYLFDALVDKGAAKMVKNSDELAKVLIGLAKNEEETQVMGVTAKSFVDDNKGALDSVVDVIQSTLAEK